MPLCRLCDCPDADTVLSQADWLAHADRCRDERARMAALVRETPALDFGDIVRCRGCGLLSVARVPDDAALGDFYRQYYANAGYARKTGRKIARATRRIRRLQRRAAGRSFLDVGCNLGFAVEAARRLGLEAEGIDVDDAALALAAETFPGARFQTMTVQAMAATGRRFATVYCSEVLEHVRDIRGFAAALAALVDDGGVLFLTTPDGGHWRVPKPLVRWAEIKPPEHLTWFAKPHLRRLFEAQGLTVGFGFNPKPGIKMLARRPLPQRP